MTAITNSAMLLEVFQKIVELCDKGATIQFQPDLGKNTLTIFLDGRHNHIGIPEWTDEAFDVLVKNLYTIFIGGLHLSWAEGD